MFIVWIEMCQRCCLFWSGFSLLRTGVIERILPRCWSNHLQEFWKLSLVLVTRKRIQVCFSGLKHKKVMRRELQLLRLVDSSSFPTCGLE